MATFTNVSVVCGYCLYACSDSIGIPSLSSILVTRMMLNIRDHDPCPESSLLQKSKEASLQFYHPHISVSRQPDIESIASDA